MKIVLDTSKCISCGTCEALCSKFFVMKDGTTVSLRGSQRINGKEELETQGDDCVKEAVDNCPVQCIRITNS